MRWIASVLMVAACGSDDGGDCPAYANIIGGTFARSGAMTTWAMVFGAGDQCEDSFKP